MAKSTVVQAAKDEKDIFEQGASEQFVAQWGAGEQPDTPEASAFSDWWSKDTTQEKFQGLMGVLGALGSGLAGIPAGGTDMSSLERGAVRMTQAPGEARKQMQEKRFVDYLDDRIAKETDPGQRDMLEAARANPKQAAPYLAMESPESKQKRLEAIAEIEHDYKMDEIGLQNTGKYMAAGLKNRQITPGRQDLIDSAAAWFRSIPADVRSEVEAGRSPVSLLFDASAIKFMPYLYSPNGGPLYRGPNDINIDLSGTVQVIGEGGEKETWSKYDYVMSKVVDNYDQLDPEQKRFWNLVLMKFRSSSGDGEMSEEASAAARSIGLE